MPEEPPTSAQAAAAKGDWIAYYDAVAGKGPRETLLEAMERFEKEVGVEEGAAGQRPVPLERLPLAIDLGCGEGRDTEEILARGWRVLAIDAHPEGIARLRARAPCREAEADGRLEVAQAGFHEASLPACRLLNASFSLPFCPPGHFDDLWGRIVASIESGGRFAGQLFGDRDTWSSLPDRTHHSRARAVGLFDDFVLESFHEEDRPGEDASGFRKHWHMFHVVARKRGAESPRGSGEAR